MTDFLKDQARFMQITGQTVGQNNPEQTALYETLLAEELEERHDSIEIEDAVEEFDADLDILVVHLGRMLSRWPVEMIEAGWAEVVRSNLSKAVPCVCIASHNFQYASPDCQDCGGTGRTVLRRAEDNKILKGPQYSPPDLKSVMGKYGRT